MEPWQETALWVLAATEAVMVFLWAVSVRGKDAGIVDRWWGLGFVLAGLLAWRWTGVDGPRLFLLALVGLWGVRLSAHIYGRSRGEPEDPRYAAMRRRAGARWKWQSLFQVFLLQGLLLWLLAAPVLMVLLRPAGPAVGWLDGIGITVFVVGLLLEGLADMQLQLHRIDPAKRGTVLDRGLWRLSRHPNYFGEAVVWWGLWMIAYAHGFWWTVFAPILLTFLLLRVSGVTLLDKHMEETRPDYADYKARTSAFVPWPPRSPRPPQERAP